MDTVIRAVVVYGFLLVIFRVSGKRTLNDVTTFDLVLTLIISEAVQGALVDNDDSLTTAMLLVSSLVGLNILLSLMKRRFPWLDRMVEDEPVLVIREGKLERDVMAKERVDEQDILSSARQLQGISRLDGIRHAVLEAGGHITIIPKAKGDNPTPP
jgi:uncharacterized membrane protein YcaP (DUF421 family)